MAESESSPTSDLSSATEAVRQSARWIATAFAGVGALLVAGLQLRDVTRANLEPTQLVVAGIALLVVLAGVSWVVYSASQVLTSYFSTVGQVNQVRLAVALPANAELDVSADAELDLSADAEVGLPTNEKLGPDIAVPKWVRADLIGAVDLNRQTLFAVPLGGIGELEDYLWRTSEALQALSTGHEYYRDSRGQAWKKSELQSLNDIRDRLTFSGERVVQFSNDFVARSTYRRFRKVAFWGAVLALVGIVTIVMVTGTNDRGSAVTRPTPVSLVLTEQGLTEVAAKAGEQCVLGQVKGVAVSGQWLEPTVAIPQTPWCQATIITLRRQSGTAVPIVTMPTTEA
jgi:hypothetical protein